MINTVEEMNITAVWFGCFMAIPPEEMTTSAPWKLGDCYKCNSAFSVKSYSKERICMNCGDSVSRRRVKVKS